MNWDDDVLERHLPGHLIQQDRSELRADLRAISRGRPANFVLSNRRDEFADKLLQGDGWRGLELYDPTKGSLRRVKGLILSNSCDLDPANHRALPTRLTFSPLIRLSDFRLLLKSAAWSENRIESRVESVRAQLVDNTFFLPAGGQLEEDSMVRFGDIHSMPTSDLTDHPECEKLFTLNNTGFYMLALKLSVHFCRLHEGISRR